MRITWERRRLDAIIQIFVYAGLPAAPVCGNRSLWNQINYLCQFPQEPAKHTAHHKFVQKIGCPLWPRRSTVFSVCVCNCERVCRGAGLFLALMVSHSARSGLRVSVSSHTSMQWGFLSVYPAGHCLRILSDLPGIVLPCLTVALGVIQPALATFQRNTAFSFTFLSFLLIQPK